MVLIDPMAGNTPTEKQADTEYTANTNKFNFKVRDSGRATSKKERRQRMLEILGLLKTHLDAQIKYAAPGQS